MQTYELTILLDGKVSAAKKKAVVESLSKIFKVLGVVASKPQEWGVKDLAYKIGKSSTGVYLHYALELDTKSTKALTDKLKVEEDILRFLVIRKDK